MLHPLFLGICLQEPEVCTDSQASYQEQRGRNSSNLSLSLMRFKPGNLLWDSSGIRTSWIGEEEKSSAELSQGQLFDALALCSILPRRGLILPC